MFKYLFQTGLFGAVTSGRSLYRNTREQRFTWRTALVWVSWGISLVLAIAAVTDMRREAKEAKRLNGDSPE